MKTSCLVSLVLAIVGAAASADILQDTEPAEPTARLDGPLQERMLDMATDSAGNTYVVGSFDSAKMTLQVFGDAAGDDGAAEEKAGQKRMLNNAGGNDIFVAKYDAQGNLLWARSAGGTGDDYGTGVVVDASGNVYITGSYSGEAEFGDFGLESTLRSVPAGEGRLTNSGLSIQSEIFVAMLDGNGGWQWARRLDYKLRSGTTTTGYVPHGRYDFGPAARVPASGYLRAGEDAFNGSTFGWTARSNVNQAQSIDDGGWKSNDSDPKTRSYITVNDDSGNSSNRGWRLNLKAGSYRFRMTCGIRYPENSDRHHVLYSTSEGGSGTVMNVRPQGSQGLVTSTWIQFDLASDGWLWLRAGQDEDYTMFNYLDVDTVATATDTQVGGIFGMRSGDDQHSGKALAIDQDGHLYLKGRFIDLQDIGSAGNMSLLFVTATGAEHLLDDGGDHTGARNSFVTRLKLANAGAVKSDPAQWSWDWLTMFGTGQEISGPYLADNIVISDLAVNPMGDLFVTGAWRGRLLAGGAARDVTNNVPGQANTEGFLLRLRRTDGMRTMLATMRVDEAADANRAIFPEAVVADADGSAYVLGNYNNRFAAVAPKPWEFRSSTGGEGILVTPGSDMDFFVAKANSSGEWQWVTGPSSTGRRVARSLALDTARNVLVTGSLRGGPVTFGDDTLENVPSGAVNPFLAKLTSTGTNTPVWVRAMGLPAPAGSTSESHGVDLAPAPGGKIRWLLGSGPDTSLSVDEGANHQIGARTGAAAGFDTLQRHGGLLLGVDATPLNDTGYFISQEIAPPGGAFLDALGRPLQPEIRINGQPFLNTADYFHWDDTDGKLYLLQPIADAELHWRVSGDLLNEQRVVQPIESRLPNDADRLPGDPVSPVYQLHVSGGGADRDEPAVTLETAASPYQFARMVAIGASSASVTGKVFRSRADRTFDSWATLVYTRKAGAPVSLPNTLVLPVRTRHFRDVVGDPAAAVIGTEIDGSAHGHADPSGKNGFVLNTLSRYDGEGSDAAHLRAERTGPIIPVNRDEPGEADDLVVAWYSVNPRSATAWPTQAVLYRAAWPVDATTTVDGVTRNALEKIFIVSQLGSEMELFGTNGQPATVAVDCGGAGFTDSGGTAFAADNGFTGGTAFSHSRPIAGTADEALYQRGRTGASFSYALPTGNGSFLVTLHFSELAAEGPADPDDPAPSARPRRGTNLFIEGAPAESAIVIAERVGAEDTAYTLEVPAIVADGVLNLRFDRMDGYDEAQVNAIKVVPANVYRQDKLDPAKYLDRRIYHQPDKGKAGYNPNEEHALLAPSKGSTFDAVFALRDDLNHRVAVTSDPYVLMKYRDATDGGKWKFKVYEVAVTGSIAVGTKTHTFDFTNFKGLAGRRVQPPYPLSLFADRPETGFDPTPAGIRNAYWKDHKGGVWARCAGQVIAKYWYPLQPNFWFDKDGNGVSDGAAACPWLEFHDGPNSTPAANDAVKVVYDIAWPPLVPKLFVGETLREAKRGMPDVRNWAAGALIFDEDEDAVGQLDFGGPGSTRMMRPTARLIDSMSERAVSLDVKVAGKFLTSQSGDDLHVEVAMAEGGRYEFPLLPPHLRPRLRLDMSGESAQLIFRGVHDTSQPAAPLELLNVLSRREEDDLLAFGDEDTTGLWETAVKALFKLTRNPNGILTDHLSGVQDGDLFIGLQHRVDVNGVVQNDIVPETVFAGFALTAGLGEGAGYITLSENNDPALGALPVALHVIRVVEPPVVGSVRVILSQDPLDEKITLHHSADFGGDPDGLFFRWYVKQDIAGRPAPDDVPPPNGGNGWLVLHDGPGLNSVTIEGSGIRTLADHWAYCRYRKVDPGQDTLPAGWQPRNNLFSTDFGGYAGDPAYVTKNAPMFVPGWIKRVLEGINPFEQRVKDFHQAPTSSYTSMIQQAGTPYQGAAALNSNADNLNGMGLIELYETVLHRGFDLSINGTPSQTNAAVDNALLLAASRISDLYMLLGNEAYADAQDPTIGVGADMVNVVNSSTFAFQNQLPNLIEEELALLRGRDDSLAGVQAAPVFNRLYWNFTSGLEGEPAYVLNYEIADTAGSPTGGPDGFIRENDAAAVYPMGHGDAWGHYLSAAKSYYRLLRHPLYTWTPRSETTLVAGVSVTVDYLDEVKFARAAAARAKAAESIVDLTYRSRYVADPAGQWQGYKDTDTGRAWGVDEWARRAGQGAVLDWAVANAVLPEESPSGTNALNRIDRHTVEELDEIASAHTNLQGILDRADQGLNPLGLHNDVVPFDIDPQVTDTLFGQPHFEQIYGRAEKAVSNARSAFEHANGLTQQLRSIAMSAEQYRQEIAGQEADYKNRLIEIYGYPYSGDIGPGKAYPTGYDGPDLYKWMYVPVANLTDDTMPPVAEETFGFYNKMQFEGSLGEGGDFESVLGHYFPGDVPEEGLLDNNNALPLAVPYELSAGRWAFAAQPTLGARRAPGRLQMALNALLEAQAGLETAQTNYDGFVLDVQDAADLLQATYDLQTNSIAIREKHRNTQTDLSKTLAGFATASRTMQLVASTTERVFEPIIEGIPKVAGIAASDVSAPARGALYGSKNLIAGVAEAGEAAFDIAGLWVELGKEDAELSTEIEIEKAGYRNDIQQQLKALEQLLRNEINMRLEIFQAQRRLEAAVGDFQATLAEGQRLIEERIAFRRKMAGPVQQLRYQDITFRNYRNEALQRYKASFDLAGRYLFLAAKAYDYETCLLGSSTKAGQQFLNGIVRQRALGQFNGDAPVHGVNGLSDPMARMKTSFDGLRSQLGFNNPQMETGQFSLRHELFRLGDASDEEWQQELARHYVPDLWREPKFRQHCRPFAPEAAGPQPGLVIPFGTTVTYGLNFFNWPLAGGDSTYDSSRFATKVRSVGVWFENYSGLNLSTTPRVYLVPVGLDVLRSPTGNTLAIREFNVVDQALPDPFPLGASDLGNPRYIPMLDSLDGEFTAIRQFGRFRAYHSAGAGNLPLLNEMTTDSRLVGRSVWNTQWLLIIPGGTFLGNANEGLDTFIYGKKVPGSSTERDGNGNTDIKLFFETYSYQGL